MSYDRPLMAWLSGHRYYQKSPFYIANEDFQLEGAWLAIDLHVPLHEAAELELRPFNETWDATLAYLDAACRMLDRPRPGWAPPKADADKILARLGPPPLRCYSIYLITVEETGRERCVYVGQTNSRHHRFRSGHAAISALHHPRFDGLVKRLYLAGIHVADDDDHMFPVEWIHPEDLRKPVLDSIEGRLIYDLQPELNDRLKKSEKFAYDLPISVQNTVSHFLDAESFGADWPYRDDADS